MISSAVFSTPAGIVLHELDVGELAAAGLLRDLRVQRVLGGEVDQQLLRLAARMQPVLEQARRVRDWART